jgi:hypothetical protein
MRIRILLASALLVGSAVRAQNVGINPTGAAPDGSAMLDISATNRGLLVPRVALTAANNNAPIGAAVANSLLVFNTATSGAGINTVRPGYYYWDGTAARWQRLAAEGESWRVQGNLGTDAATNFLGTIDGVPLRIRTNNIERFEVTTGTGGAAGTGGRLWAFQNGTAASPAYSWSTSTGMGLFRQSDNVLGMATGGVERFRLINDHQLRAMDNGTAAVPNYSWNTSPGTGLFLPANNTLGLATNATERVRIQPAGQVGINGVPANSAQLDVQATNRGVLIPRVALLAANSSAPVGAAVENSMLVYNTATAGAGVNAVFPGFYYWESATARWRRLVDLITDVWLTNPINIAPLQTVILTINIPGVTFLTGCSVALSGDWATSPTVTIEHVEARTGQVRFRVYNYSLTTTYNGMDFLITTTRY